MSSEKSVMARILIVDDMAVFREPVAAALEKYGYQVLTADGGTSALATVSEYHPDLILLDISMPDIDGIEVLRQLRSNPNNRVIRVIMLTDANDRKHVVEAAKQGISGYLLKSQFSLKSMLEKIDEVLGKAKTLPTSNSQIPNEETPSAHLEPDHTVPATTCGRETSISLSDEKSNLASIKPIVTRSEISEKIEHSGELKALSPTVGHILKLTASERCSIEQLAKVIKQDQAITLKILKLANSSVYTRGDHVDSVQKAVMRIGLSQIREAVMNIAVIDRFNNHEKDKQISSEMFWEHSIATGLIAAELTRAVGKNDVDIEAAFTMGLLHDVGRMIYFEVLGDIYSTVLDTAQRLALPLERVEARMLLVNHAEMMDRALRMWNFSKHLIDPIALHHLSISNIRGLSPRMVNEVSILALANRLAHAMLLGSSGNDTIYPTEEFVAALNVQPMIIQQIIEQVPHQCSDLKNTMLSIASVGHWPQTIQQVQDKLHQPVKPIFISANPEIDAYGIFCHTITSVDSNVTPNLAVVHLNSVREKETLTQQLQQAESEAGVNPLPLLIISPKDSLVIGNRTVISHILQPTPISRLITKINALFQNINATPQSPKAA